MMKEFKDRLLHLWNQARPTQIARDLSWSVSGVARILNNNTMPKAETLIAIQKLKGCDWHWLMTGEGEAFPDETHTAFKTTLQELNPLSCDINDQINNLNKFVFIPFYNQTESALPQLALAFRRDWLENNFQVDPQNLSISTIKGDTMESVLSDGDYILIDHTQNMPDDGIYAIRIGNNVQVKRTQLMPENKLWIRTANEAYDPFSIDLSRPNEHFAIIGKVIWSSRKIY